MFPRDWKHFKKLLIKINIVLVINATMNSGRTNLNCEAFCSACCKYLKVKSSRLFGRSEKNYSFLHRQFVWEVKWTLDTLFRFSQSHQKFHIFHARFVVWLFDETLPLVFNLLPERVQSYHWRIVITICFYKAFSLCSFLDCCSLVPE